MIHMGGSWGAKQSLGDSEDISPKYRSCASGRKRVTTRRTKSVLSKALG